MGKLYRLRNEGFISYLGKAVGKRPLNRHALRSPILVHNPVQQLSPSINVALVVGLEVFRQHTDRIASQPPLGFPIATAQFYTLSRISFVHKPVETV